MIILAIDTRDYEPNTYYLQTRPIEGITANEDHCRSLVQQNIGLVTALVPALGYDVCSRLAKDALENNRSVYDLVLEKQLLSKLELDRLLDPANMVGSRRKR